MGAVYRAFDRERNQIVALKSLLTPDATSIYRFKREFRALANVSHPNLVALYDLISSGDEWFFTMELVEGLDLLSYVRPHDPARPAQVSQTREFGPDDRWSNETLPSGAMASTVIGADDVGSADSIDDKEVVAQSSDGGKYVDLERLQVVMVQLAKAISALHETGHLHRDIKPSNVLVTPEGRVVVLDFGIITELAGAMRKADDQIAGTPSFMAPELLDNVEASEASDWYAFGVVLFQALTGRRPFKGGQDTVFRAKRLLDVPIEMLDYAGAPPHLRQLCADLLQRDPGRRPSGAEILRRLQDRRERPSITTPPPVAPSLTSVLVGREAELEALHKAWTDSRTDTGVGVFLHGPSGVGKSALVEKFLDELEERSDAVILTGRCYEQESVPYKALDSLVDAVARFLLPLDDDEVRPILPDDIGALARAFPVLGRVKAIDEALATASVDTSDRSELQRRAFAALSELIERMAKHRALCLYIDDLQWGDVESAGFLARLLGPHGPQVLFIAGYRSEHIEDSPLLPTLFHSLGVHLQTRVRMLEVKPLGVNVLVELARGLLNEATPGANNIDDRARAIAEEAKGSAYFVHELVRYSATQPGKRTSREETLASVIKARAGQLSAPAQRLLRVVSVAGWRMSVGVAQAAAELGPEGGRAFVELRAQHFIKSTGTRESDTVEPYHDRVREMINEGLAPDEAKHVHHRIAESLEAAGGSGAEHIYALAHHWYRAAPADRQDHVCETNLRAARTAADSYAYHQAHTYFSQAQEAADRCGATLDADTDLLMADVWARIGLAEDAVILYERALDKSRDPMQRAAIRWGISRVQLGWLDTAKAIDEALDALDEIKMRPPKNTVLSWLAALGAFVIGLFNLRRFRNQGIPEGPERERRRLASHLYVHLGLAYYFHLEPQNILRSTLHMLRSVAPLGPSRQLVEWYILAGGAAAALRKKKLNQKLRRSARLCAEQIGDPVGVARSRLYRGIFCDMVGEPLRGEPLMARALEEFAALFDPVDYYSGAACLAWNRMMRGHAVDAWAVIDRTLQLDAAGGQLNPVKGHSYRAYAGPILAMLGRIDEGRAHMEQRERELVNLDAGARWRHSQHLSHSIIFLYEADDVGPKFDDYVAKYQALKLNAPRLPFTFRHGYIGIAYGQRRQIELCDEVHRAELLATLHKTLELVRVTAKGHPILLGHRSVLEASYYNFTGNHQRARQLLEEAEDLALETENDWVRFEVTMEKYRFAMAKKNVQSARKEIEQALTLARDRGWSAWESRCASLLDQLTVVAAAS